MNERELRKKVIRLAHENPELRGDLLPVLASHDQQRQVQADYSRMKQAAVRKQALFQSLKKFLSSMDPVKAIQNWFKKEKPSEAEAEALQKDMESQSKISLKKAMGYANKVGMGGLLKAITKNFLRLNINGKKKFVADLQDAVSKKNIEKTEEVLKKLVGDKPGLVKMGSMARSAYRYQKPDDKILDIDDWLPAVADLKKWDKPNAEIHDLLQHDLWNNMRHQSPSDYFNYFVEERVLRAWRQKGGKYFDVPKVNEASWEAAKKKFLAKYPGNWDAVQAKKTWWDKNDSKVLKIVFFILETVLNALLFILDVMIIKSILDR